MAAKRKTRKVSSALTPEQKRKTFKTESAKPKSTSPVISPNFESSKNETSDTNANSSITNGKPFWKKPVVLILGILIILGVIGYLLRSWFIVAQVNGQPIYRLDYQHQLELQSGSQVLNALIARQLILQEADKKHIVVSQADINNQVNAFQKVLTKQGQSLDQYLAYKNITKQDFYDQVKVQMIIEKLLANNIKVSNAEITDYINQNKDTLQGVNPADLNQEVKQQIQSQKLQDILPTYVQSLQKKAQVVRYVNP